MAIRPHRLLPDSQLVESVSSGPLLDRIDIPTDVPRVEYEKLSDQRLGEPSADIRARVETARQRQQERFVSLDISTNVDMPPGEVRRFCQLDQTGSSLRLNQLAL